MSRPVTRRGFLGAASAAGAVLSPALASSSNGKLALHGGTPVRREPFPSWPRIAAEDEDNVMDVLRSGEWFRGTSGRWAKEFEEKYAAALKAARLSRLPAGEPRGHLRDRVRPDRRQVDRRDRCRSSKALRGREGRRDQTLPDHLQSDGRHPQGPRPSRRPRGGGGRWLVRSGAGRASATGR